MGKARKPKESDRSVIDYRHTDDTRTNIPTAVTAGQGTLPKAEKKRYYYNPHLSPVLRFDSTGKSDKIMSLLDKACKEPITAEEHMILAEALRNHQPWLEWTGKREAEEKGWFEVDPVALNIHERISTQAILRSSKREDVQRELFADPHEPWQEAVKFYQHDIDWTNRLILGDSLQVMSSLAHRENLAGKVQMIYIDPPYGINYRSNFQSTMSKYDVKDKDSDLSREAEMIKAYRDTWSLGIHSYIGYISTRFHLAKRLLSPTGSIFVQISTQNVHLLRNALDAVFGGENFCGQIIFKKTVGQTSELLAATYDYVLWYSKDADKVKFKPLYRYRSKSEDISAYPYIESRDSSWSRASGPANDDQKLFGAGNTTSQTGGESSRYSFIYEGQTFHPSGSGRGWTTNQKGLDRLSRTRRLIGMGNTLVYKRYIDDFPVVRLTMTWDDTIQSTFSVKKLYVVQTASTVIQRCLLMTTDPGDLVLDPTCGSGTTAYVAEQWGRRWITIDTSRVALAIARQRLMTARFENYKTKKPTGGMAENPGTGFIYKTVPHITLKSIAQNTNLDPIFEKHEPVLDEKLLKCNSALSKASADLRKKLETKLQLKQKQEGKKSITDADERRWVLKKKWEHWEVPFDTDPDWPAELRSAVSAYRTAWRAKMDEVNACIAANADQEELVDQPESAPGVRVAGPFTVEGVIPAEASLYEKDDVEDKTVEGKNSEAYLEQMVRLLKIDGITFKGNKVRRFGRIEPLWNNAQDLAWHAEGWWEGEDSAQKAKVGIFFGPQYGPVTAAAFEEVMPKAGRTYSELVVAGFSFDPEAVEIIGDQSSHPRLMVHQAFIRPDINPGMEGLLKDQPRSQLFTVFGQPDIVLKNGKGDEYMVTLKGVDIYDPLTGSITSTRADKVAAWFLDTDYDGRCFCMTQAFFPDQDAWEKIAKALKTNAEQYAFEALKGTVSIPFKAGVNKKVAVKVIDPRGNEVMIVKKLEK